MGRDVVLAELVGVESADEMKQFLDAAAEHASSRRRFLFKVRASRAIFRVERQGLLDSLRRIARTQEHRVAWLAEGRDLRIAFDYLELLARQQRLSVRSFRTEGKALQWLESTGDGDGRAG